MNYSQLDFTNNNIKRVNLIGGIEVGIVQSLIDKYPNDFVNLDGRANIPLDTMDWYYNTETDTFIQTADLPIPEPPTPEPIAPPEPTNAELLQTVNDLKADLEIAGVL